MIVAELITRLMEFDGALPVFIESSGGEYLPNNIRKIERQDVPLSFKGEVRVKGVVLE